MPQPIRPPYNAPATLSTGPAVNRILSPSLALLTDLYQVTMAYGYWKARADDKEAVFHLFFRRNPFRGGFSVACGLARAIAFLSSSCFRFEREDLAYLAGLRGNDGKPLFEEAFLEVLDRMGFCCDVDAVPEGTVVFPHEPLLRVRGPIIQAQLLETPLLNIVNFQTLIATKAARVALAARGEPVLEFGLRRAHGVDGALSASYAAYVGGAAATSNLLAGKLFGIPVRGTHAHSWVMSFDDEREAFRAYADAMPANCVFLVDTYDTLEGVRRAAEVGRLLRERGHVLAGVRLDSGDLAYLSIEARKILDAAGFQDAAIVASNDLDEHIIASLKEQGARIAVWGVGTRLVTGHDEPALGGVYKLAAVRRPGETWRYTVKLSEQAVKTSTPGILQVRRFRSGSGSGPAQDGGAAEGETEGEGGLLGDMIYDEESGIRDPDAPTLVDPADMTRRKTMPAGARHEDLLVPVFRAGKPLYEAPPIHDARARTQAQLARFHAGIKRFVNPHEYPVGLEASLFDRKMALILGARERGS